MTATANVLTIARALEQARRPFFSVTLLTQITASEPNGYMYTNCPAQAYVQETCSVARQTCSAAKQNTHVDMLYVHVREQTYIGLHA